MNQPELPNLVSLLEIKYAGTPFAEYLCLWQNVIFSLICVFVISAAAFFASRKASRVPGRLQAAVEAVVSTLDDFVQGIIGPKGRKYTPFIGTLFIYVLFMNLFGLIPFMKSPTSSWSTTLALALCVFFYLQFTSIKELGFFGYIDHLMGRPRGIVAFSVFIPIMMLFMEIISELVRPVSLSLRLRNNVWGDEMLMTVLSGFGLAGVPLLLFSSFLIIIAAVVQAVVFSLLSAIYFALVLRHEE